MNSKKLNVLYKKPITNFTYDDIVFFAQALESNHLKRSTDTFFKEHPEFASEFIKKYREHVKKVCPNANVRRSPNKNKSPNANVRRSPNKNKSPNANVNRSLKQNKSPNANVRRSPNKNKSPNAKNRHPNGNHSNRSEKRI